MLRSTAAVPSRVAPTARRRGADRRLTRAAAGVEPLESRLLMSTNAWKAAVSGNWEDAGKWSLGHVPTAAEDVTITATGTYTVSVHGQSDTASSVTVGTSSNHTQTLTLSADDTNGSAAFSTGGGTIFGSVLLANASVRGYSPQLTVNGTLPVAAGGTLTAAGAADAIRGDYVIVNAGGTLAVNGTVAVTSHLGLNLTGNYSQSATSTFAATLGAGLFSISGKATLAGLLDVYTAAGFKAVVGTSYPVMTYASKSGDFTAIDGYSLGGGVEVGKSPAAAEYDVKAVVARADAVVPTVSAFAATPVVKATTLTFTVTYADNVAIDVSTLAAGNVSVTGPGGVTLAAKLVSISKGNNGTPRSATYSVVPVGGRVDVGANGTYTVKVAAGSVKDTKGNAVAAATAGTFTVAVSPVLTFSVQPKAVVAGKAISPSVVVKLTDQSGNALTTNTSTVTIGVASGPGSVGGTVAVAAVKGVATFANLVLTKAGTYTLKATDGAATAAVSGSFAVSAAAAAKLVFTKSTGSGKLGVALSPAVTVAVQDAYGNVVSGNTSKVTLSFATGPSGGTISGTVSVSAVAGVATFATLKFGKAGKYTLKAVDGSLTSAVSGTFTIV